LDTNKAMRFSKSFPVDFPYETKVLRKFWSKISGLFFVSELNSETQTVLEILKIGPKIQVNVDVFLPQKSKQIGRNSKFLDKF